MIDLEAPGVEADGDVVDERIGAGEIKVDQPGQPVAEKEHIVGKQIGVDDALRQALRPGAFERVQFGRDQAFEIALRPRRRARCTPRKLPPAGDRERVVAPHGEIGAGEMQPRQRLAERARNGRRSGGASTCRRER